MPDIRHSIPIKKPFAEVFPFVSTAEGFTKWWAADVAEVPSTKIIDLYFFNRSTLYRLQPNQVLAPLEITWFCLTGEEWGGTRINFKLTPKVDQCVLQFAHLDWQAETEYFFTCNTTWGELLYRLKSAAEGRPRGPLFSKHAMAY
jgi:hypothetical protein